MLAMASTVAGVKRSFTTMAVDGWDAQPNRRTTLESSSPRSDCGALQASRSFKGMPLFYQSLKFMLKLKLT